MNTLWTNSLELMLLGMGSVFVFLTLLVIATSLMSIVIRSLNQRQDSHESTLTQGDDENEIVAAALSAWLYAKKSRTK